MSALEKTAECSNKASEDLDEKSSISLTPAQEKAVTLAEEFVHNSTYKDEFVFTGLAGTGKTTSAVELISRLKEDGYRIAVCAPTGKAAHVLNSKQELVRAQTIHRALTKRPYDFLAKIHERLDELEALNGNLSPAEKEEEERLYHELAVKKKDGNNLTFEPIDLEDFDYNLLIFDESSMIGKREHYDLLIERIPCPKIFIGDGAQLPPVKDVPGVDLFRPNARLTEILRQGKDSGILEFAHRVHQGKVMRSKEIEEYPDLTVVPTDKISRVEDFAKDHQIITWTNPDRYRINPIVRELRGFAYETQEYPHWPMPGEQLMVYKNDEEARLLRGQLFTVNTVMKHPVYPDNPYLAWIMFTDDRGVNRPLGVSLVDMTPSIPYTTRRGQDIPLVSSGYDKNARRIADKIGIQMRWPYAVTAHTSQGSEWDKVYVYGGAMMPEGRSDWRSWWYTAATRAKSELVVASSYFRHH